MNTLDYKTKKEKFSLESSLLGIVMLALLLIKGINFYSLLNVGKFVLPLACLTTLIVAGIYLIVSIFSQKAANITLAVLYFLASVIMAIDLVYYNYMGKFPSVGLLKMAWQVGNVTGSVKDLITWRQLFPVLDFPLWVIWLVVRRFVRSVREKKHGRMLPVLSSFIFTAALALTILASILFGGFKFAFMSNEMFIYHAKDIKNFFVPDVKSNVDKSEYEQTVDNGNPYFGVAKGRNVFLIQVEALQDFVIDAEWKGQELTPTLNSLIRDDSLYFDNYFYQVGGGNTSDAEFTVNNSLYAPETEGAYVKYTDNTFYGLPWILKDNGYSKAVAFHGYYEDFWNRAKAYPGQGFDDFISIEDFKQNDEWVWNMGLSDSSMFTQTAEIVKEYEQPFYSFIITISTHSPFAMPLQAREIDKDNMSPDLFVLYIQSVNYFDRMLGEFFDKLKEEGLYDNSIFVIYGDHYAITNNEEKYRKEVCEATGDETYDIYERFKVPMIIHIPGLGEAKTFDTVGAHVDVLPTLLCLLGLENDKSVMFGHNLLDPDYEGIAYEMMHVRVGSFIMKDVFYMNSEGGIHSSVYTRNGASTDLADYADIVKAAEKAYADCMSLIENDDVVIKK